MKPVTMHSGEFILSMALSLANGSTAPSPPSRMPKVQRLRRQLTTLPLRPSHSLQHKNSHLSKLQSD
jgi:hypothetical protein